MNYSVKEKIEINVRIPEYEVERYNDKTSKYCLLIPVFNEGERLKSQLKKMKDAGVYEKVDVIICDAGSKDGSTEKEFLIDMRINSKLKRIGNGRYSTDIKMGYDYALSSGYEGIITVDGNDKDDVSSIGLFIDKLDNGFDYVQGSRFIKGGIEYNTPKIRKWALKLINEPIMSIAAHKHLTDTTNGFRAYSKKFLLDDRVLLFREVFYGYELIYYLPVRASRLKFNVIEVPVTRGYPKNEVPSKIGGIKGYKYQMSILFKILMKKYNP